MKHKTVGACWNSGNPPGVQIHYLKTTNSNKIKVKDVFNVKIKSF